MAEKTKTTLADRASTGAVNAAWWGGITAIAMVAANVGAGLFTKKPQKLFGKLDWMLTGGAAAFGGLWSFFTADKSKELQLQRAIEAVGDPNNPASDKERSKQIEKIITDAQNGKMPEEPETTKFRDKIKAERSAAPSVPTP